MQCLIRGEGPQPALSKTSRKRGTDRGVAANGRKVRSADLGCRKVLRGARTTASVQLRRGVVTKSQGPEWAGTGVHPDLNEHRICRTAA